MSDDTRQLTVKQIMILRLKPIRACRYRHHHHCAVCDTDITDGQSYYDGGYGRAAHVACLDEAADELAPHISAEECSKPQTVVRSIRELFYINVDGSEGAV